MGDGHVDFLKKEDYREPTYETSWEMSLDDDEDEVEPRGGMMGSSHSYKYSFDTLKGADFDQEVKFVYERSWMLHEFPKSANMQGKNTAKINIVAKAEFAHDINGLRSLPSNLTIKKGDLVRLVFSENPSTGFTWHSNALLTENAAIREVYNGFEAP